MKLLLNDHSLASTLGGEGKKIAMDRFNITRFTEDWYKLITDVVKQANVKKAA